MLKLIEEKVLEFTDTVVFQEQMVVLLLVVIAGIIGEEVAIGLFGERLA